MVNKHNEVLEGDFFRQLRDSLKARIETDDMKSVCNVLGVSEDEPGIMKAG
jgi:hypothetical protein